MKQELREFLEENLQLVDEGDYVALYKKAIYDNDYSLTVNDIGDLTQLLWDCGADPLSKFTAIPEGFFAGMKTALIKIPDNIVDIAPFAFIDANVFKVYIPESVSSISSETFAESTVDIIQTSMPMSQWMNCFNRNSNCLFDYAKNGCWRLQNHSGSDISHLIIQNVNTVTSIPFQGCSSFKTIEVCEGVTQFDTYAFRHCEGLTAIHLPRSLARMRMYCLADCPNLKTIYYAGTADEWNNIKKSQTWLFYDVRRTHECELITADNKHLDLKQRFIEE